MPGGILRVAHCGPLHKEEKEIRHLLAHSVANAVIRQATASELWLSAQAPVRDCWATIPFPFYFLLGHNRTFGAAPLLWPK